MDKKTKKKHFQNINLSDITDNKKLWTTVRPCRGNKLETNHKIKLV